MNIPNRDSPMTRFAEHRGCRLAYAVRGDGPPVLFIQGVGVHGHGWKPQIDELSKHFTCIAFDNRGIGRSQPAGSAISLDQMADDARAVLDAAGMESAHVVGHSLGGLAAQMLALNHRARVRSLSLLCTFANGRAVAPLSSRMIWLGLRTRIGTWNMRRNAFLKFILPPGPNSHEASELAALFGHDLVKLPSAVPMQLKAMRSTNLLPRLPELTELPTQVISAAHDLLAPPALGQAIAGGIRAAAFSIVSEAAHGLPITHARQTNEFLSAFLRGNSR